MLQYRFRVPLPTWSASSVSVEGAVVVRDGAVEAVEVVTGLFNISW